MNDWGFFLIALGVLIIVIAAKGKRDLSNVWKIVQGLPATARGQTGIPLPPNIPTRNTSGTTHKPAKMNEANQ